MKETDWQQDRYPKWNSNPGELEPPSNPFPSKKQLHNILSIAKMWRSRIKWYSFKLCCSSQLIKRFQGHLCFDPPKDGLCREDLVPCYAGSNWVLEKLFPWISHFWGQILSASQGPASSWRGTVSFCSECGFLSLSFFFFNLKFFIGR